MEAKQPAGANHRDKVDDLIRSRPTERAEAPLQYVCRDCDNQRGAHASAREFWDARDTE